CKGKLSWVEISNCVSEDFGAGGGGEGEGVPPPDSHRRRRMFAGMKSLSVFGGRSARGDSPSSRSISLPESRSPGSAVGTRPFGQPLCLSETINENGSVANVANVKAKNRLRYTAVYKEKDNKVDHHCSLALPYVPTIPLAPHSPRRQKLNLRMKSLSLDSPESTEHVQRRRHAAQSTCIDPQSSQSSSSRIQCNC
ncbi:hypothetical protein C0J52_27891, partial [Blattella germanica]